MALQQDRPPAYSHDPESLQFPKVPRQEVASNRQPSALNLPDLVSLGLPDSKIPQPNGFASHPGQYNHLPKLQQEYQQWHAGAPLHANNFPNVPSTALKTPSDPLSPRAESVMSYEEHGKRTPSIVSMDDPDVRMAAEALSGLGNPGIDAISFCSF